MDAGTQVPSGTRNLPFTALAKVHPPGATEFLGGDWQTIANGRKTFLGKDVTIDNNPAVKFVAPDTAEIVENSLPENISNIAPDMALILDF